MTRIDSVRRQAAGGRTGESPGVGVTSEEFKVARLISEKCVTLERGRCRMWQSDASRVGNNGHNLLGNQRQLSFSSSERQRLVFHGNREETIGLTRTQTKGVTFYRHRVWVKRSNLSALRRLGRTWKNRGSNGTESRQFVNFTWLEKKKTKTFQPHK